MNTWTTPLQGRRTDIRVQELVQNADTLATGTLGRYPRIRRYGPEKQNLEMRFLWEREQ